MTAHARAQLQQPAARPARAARRTRCMQRRISVMETECAAFAAQAKSAVCGPTLRPVDTVVEDFMGLESRNITSGCGLQGRGRADGDFPAACQWPSLGQTQLCSAPSALRAEAATLRAPWLCSDTLCTDAGREELFSGLGEGLGCWCCRQECREPHLEASMMTKPSASRALRHGCRHRQLPTPADPATVHNRGRQLPAHALLRS